MNKAHCWTSFRHLAAAAGVLAAAVGGVGAQSTSQVTVAVRGGIESYDRSASLNKAGVIAVDALYGVNRWLSIGPVLSLARPNSTGADFITPITYGVLNLGDTTSFFEAAQPVNVIDGALNVRVQLPGKKLSPYATGGIGGYAMFLDTQSNRGENHKTGLMFNVGAGLLYALSDRAGLTIDVRGTTLTDYNRTVLDPRDSQNPFSHIENTLYFEDFKPAPKNKSTVTNFIFSFGFSYVPAFFGAGGGQ